MLLLLLRIEFVIAIIDILGGYYSNWFFRVEMDAGDAVGDRVMVESLPPH